MRWDRCAVWAVAFCLVMAGFSCDGKDPNEVVDGSSENPAANREIAPAEAFIALDARRVQAVQALDLSALNSIFTADSPALRRVRASIMKLRRDHVRAEERITRLEVSVINETKDEARVRERAIFDLRFFNEAGREITKTGKPQVQTTVWILRRQDGQWRLHDAVVRRARDA